MTDRELRSLMDDPALVLRHDRAELRARLAALPDELGGVGREVFTQAEAVFGGARVSSAEFASWLHFAATVLGHDAYAERVAAAEPGLPWRTVWAWWRPVGVYEAEPNLSGDRSADVYEAGGRRLVKVWALWCADAWFDLATGERCAAPEDGDFEPLDDEAPDGPWLFDGDGDEAPLHCPESWEEPLVVDGGRFLFLDARGVVLVERNEAAAALPKDGTEPSGWTAPGDGEPWFRPGGEGGVGAESEVGDGDEGENGAGAGSQARGDSRGRAGVRGGVGPLTGDRLERAFGADGVVRVPAAELPDVLTHEPTRVLLARVGLPRHWGAGVTSFALEKDLLGPGPDGLLRVGVFDLGFCDPGEVFVHPVTGAVALRQPDGSHGPGGDAAFPLVRDLEAFVLFLEGVRRHMGACWDPYPGEEGAETFLREMAAVDAEALAEDAPGTEVWEHLFASITELSVEGY
ncbi:SUKH-4 family immunity protein [Streptomyces sp. NBC_00094]|uniref:SUKH-4 family immunity protein n=1 Tax=Streptomyces sp. NBC_00094 TaxID=2903620 RepID=UPI002257AD5E|nr:SUKH-4 family immunity protein [Streptomyces sp. NBC_00094]MCX5389216.1 SUKH-4 family immunity protein [Streptomyces sp. NBC_00094]